MNDGNTEAPVRNGASTPSLIWTGNAFVSTTVCQVCFQPECAESTGVERPAAGAIPSRLAPREREYRGYCQWAVHPEEAMFILHRGYAIVDGRKVQARFMHNEAFVVHMKIDESDITYVLEDKFNQSQAERIAA